MQIHLFGAATPSGEAFRQLSKSEKPTWQTYLYSRSPQDSPELMYPANFFEPDNFRTAGNPADSSIWISFAPIWGLAAFLKHLSEFTPDRLKGLRGLIACSSSSVITKRFAINQYDRQLTSTLLMAEELLLDTCSSLGIPCIILQPTLIYGCLGSYRDRNLSLLLTMMRRFPFFPIPAISGQRQPTHISQLADVTLYFAKRIVTSVFESSNSKRIAFGGDSIITYDVMIKSLQQELDISDPARKCRLIYIPNRLFFVIATPLLLFSPKSFEAVLRMCSDLSGFTKSHQLSGERPRHFPLPPINHHT